MIDGFFWGGVGKKTETMKLEISSKPLQSCAQWLSYLISGEPAPAETGFRCLEAHLEPLQLLQQRRPLPLPQLPHQPVTGLLAEQD